MRTTAGRYLKRVEAELLAPFGGREKATAAQRMIAARLARVMLRLEAFDAKLDAGTLTAHDGRVYGALHNAFRLLVKQLDVKGAAAEAKGPSLAQYLAAKSAARVPDELDEAEEPAPCRPRGGRTRARGHRGSPR